MFPKEGMGYKMYIFGEVITNLNRNRVLTITSIFTVFIMLLLVGVFGVFLLNISYNSEYMDNMLEIRIFMMEVSMLLDRYLSRLEARGKKRTRRKKLVDIVESSS